MRHTILALLGMALPAAAAEPVPQVTLLDLPFAVKAMRGPGSEVALSVSTSGLLPIARAKPPAASADPKALPPPVPDEADLAPIAVVWGEGGGAVISLDGETVRTTLIGAELLEGLATSETPRGAVPGSRRALSGPLSVYLSGPTRSATGARGQAAGLTLRERQPIGVTGEPRAVPVATATLSPGTDAVFAARRPRIAVFDGRTAVMAVVEAGATSSLVMLGKDHTGNWRTVARTPPQEGRAQGAPLSPAAVADFAGNGRPQIAAVRDPDGAGALQLWSYAEGAFSLVGEAPGYAGPATDEADLAAVILPEPQGTPDLALPTADRGSLAVVSLKGGISEKTRILLPGPAAFGVAALGKGSKARLLVGLADGRVAVVAARAGDGAAP